MISLSICVVSLMALGQVFVSYCRSLLGSAQKLDLSDRALEAALVTSESQSAEDFERFYQLVRLCPEGDGDRTGIRTVGVYYSVLGMMGWLMRRLPERSYPHIKAWILRERESCSHFAAVVLDRCISCSRSLFSEQASDSW